MPVNASYWEDEPDLTALHEAHGLMANDPTQALPRLEALADRGSLMSMVYLGHAYGVGTGVNVDLTKSEQWYERAARGGSALASYYLGRIYLDRRDYQGAKKYFEIGALKNYMPSVHQLGRMYANGLGVDQDLDKARDYLEKPSAAGYAFAKRDLAFLLMGGRFGILQILRGAWLFLGGSKDLITSVATDPTQERLR